LLDSLLQEIQNRTVCILVQWYTTNDKSRDTEVVIETHSDTYFVRKILWHIVVQIL